MPPRKKARGGLKRSSSDGPAQDDAGSIRKRARADAPVDTTSHIAPAPPAHKARNPVKYKSKTRLNRLSGGSPAKLTNFGFNVENKPKVGRALFHLSPSPRAKAKARSKKLFGSPNVNRRRGSRAGTSANNSKMDISVDEEEEEDEDEDQQVLSPGLASLLPPSTPPRPSSTNTGLGEDDERDDQPAPLPFLSPVKPISGPGLEIRTPLQGRIVPPSIHSLSKRIPRADGPSIPLFTPRHLPAQIPDHAIDDSPSKRHAAPVFAPTSTLASIPSTPSPKTKPTPSFAPSAQKPTLTIQDDGSPTKKLAPVFGPTPARPPASLRTEHDTNTIARPVFAPSALQTPASSSRTLPAVPPPLPTTSSSVPETTIPDTPTAQRRTPPIFAPGLLFPPPESVINGNQKAKVSRAPVFGVLDEGEERTPRAERGSLLPGETEVNMKVEEESGGGEGDLSMADVFDASMVTSEGVLDLPEQVNPTGPSILTDEPTASASTDTLGPLVPLNGLVLTGEPAPLASAHGPSIVTRSRSRSASASGSVPPESTAKVASGAGSVSSRAGSTPLSRANSVSAPGRTESRRGSNISLTPLVTDPSSLSRTNSLDQFNPSALAHLQYRLSRADAGMAETPTPGNETPPVLPNTGAGQEDETDLSTSPLSSLPEDMSLDVLDVEDEEGDDTIGNGTGNSTIRMEDTTMRDQDRSMSMRNPAQLISSSPFSLRVPTSPVSSVPGDPTMNEDVEVDVVGLSSPARPLPLPDSMLSPTTSSSSLTSLDEDTEDEEKDQGKTPAKSMIPVAKRPGAPMVAQTPSAKTTFGGHNGMTPRIAQTGPFRNGVTPGPNRLESNKNGTTSAPGRNGITPAPAKTGIPRAAPTPIRPPTGPPPRPFPIPSTSIAGSSAASLDVGKPATAKSGMATRARAGVGRTARSLAAPTASTAAKTRAKVATTSARGRITSFMKPNPTAPAMPPPAAPVPPTSVSTSPRKGMSKDDSDIRGPRRSMISDDTQASLSSLSNALEKLARTSIGNGNTRAGDLPARPGTSMGFASRPNSSLGFTAPSRPGLDRTKRPADLSASTNGKASKPSVGLGASKPAGTTSAASGKGKGKAKDGDVSRNEDDADYEVGKKSKAKDDPNAPLRSCVIFVDVRTAEGEDAGSMFMDMLRDLGARVVSKPTPSTTHFVFKSGHQSTLTKHKLYDDPRPCLVGIGWVVECAEKRQHVNEERFAIKTDEVSALDLRERRKSQLPHQMQFMARDPNPTGPKFGTTSAEAAAVAKCMYLLVVITLHKVTYLVFSALEASMAEVEQDAEAAAERSKKRTQQKLFPRVDRSPT
ncbi:hypothetical protein FRC07_010631 [Ceratobasidium sp. 392]|nr:hypothetical protein FRC07_010631 [Ceratobasidium sp. 392]